jgi:hypothetical protein
MTRGAPPRSKRLSRDVEEVLRLTLVQVVFSLTLKRLNFGAAKKRRIKQRPGSFLYFISLPAWGCRMFINPYRRTTFYTLIRKTYGRPANLTP